MKISVLIPAYNEEETIGEIVSFLNDLEYIDEILVVNDGSDDSTSLIAQNSGAIVLNNNKNKGKGAAVQAGFDFLSTDIILLLDGDLVGLKEKHIKNILAPLLYENVDMSVGILMRGNFFIDFAQKFTPNLSGQRAIRKTVINDLIKLNDVGYGVEIIINRHVKKKGKIEYVKLNDIHHIIKEEKRGILKGIFARIKMYWDLFKVIFMIDD